MQFWRASDASIRRKFRGIRRDAQPRVRAPAACESIQCVRGCPARTADRDVCETTTIDITRQPLGRAAIASVWLLVERCSALDGLDTGHKVL